MKKFFIIPHTHWDREWHKTYEEYRVRCIDFFDDVIDVLENTDFPCFILDGQTSVLRDYLEIKPNNKERIVELVQKGKLKIGPWYVQPDEFIPSLESLIKNLLISKNIANEFGDEMKIGHLPDSFGQSATMPTVLSGFGIKDVVFYRGFTEDLSQKNVFMWQGIDQSEVLAHWLPIGYGNGMFLSGELESDLKVINGEVSKLGERAFDENYLLLSGSDQCFLKEHLTKTAEQLNEFYKNDNQEYEFKVCGMEDYFASVRQSQVEIERIFAELRFGKRSRVHNSISATRQDIKAKNRKVERLYEKALEPTSVLVELLGGKYRKQLIEKGELYYIENHAHDSICSVCTDKVHEEINLRLDKAEQIAKTIMQDNKLAIYEAINFEKGSRPIVIFSSDSVKGVQKTYATVSTKNSNFKIKDSKGNDVEFEIVSQTRYNQKDEIVALSVIPDDWYYRSEIFILKEFAFVGYETLYIDENVAQETVFQIEQKSSKIQNEFYELEVNSKGGIDVYCKKDDKKHLNQFKIIDVGNAGDEYDFSPPFNDRIITSDNCLKNSRVKVSAFESQIVNEYEMYVPKTTTNERREEECELMKITSTYTLTKDIDRIDVKTTIQNNAENHKLSVEFDFDECFDTHFGTTANGIIKRDSGCKFLQKSIDEKWSEWHYPVYQLCGYMFLQNHFLLMSKSQLQYETTLENQHTKVMLTLLSSVSKMGNENLKYRPGRRSGAVCNTPDSKMLGEYTADYAVSFSKDKDCVSRKYFAKNTAINYAQQNDNGIYADKIQLVQTNIEISSFKKSENSQGYIVRLINRSGEDYENENVLFNLSLFKKCEIVDLKEDAVANENVIIKMKNNADMSNKNIFSGICHIKKMKHGEIITLRLN